MATAAAKESHHYDTIIIGAGMSGLACASRLLQHQNYQGKNRLRVLEARDRIGGRIGSVDVKGYRLDTGANWIHGVGTKEKPNPLMNILPHKRYKQLEGSVTFKVPDDEEDSAAGDGGDEQNEWVEVERPSAKSKLPKSTAGDTVIPSNIARKLQVALWGTIGDLHELAAEATAEDAKRTTILKALAKSESLQEAFQSVPEEYHSTLSSLPQFIESMEAAPLVAQSAEHPEGQAGVSLLEYAIEDFDGEQVFLQDGYIAIINEVAKDLNEAGVIELETVVKQIDWSKNPISIETNQGTYTAREVLCTLPLGILKDYKPRLSAKRLFTPALPAAKQEAINSLGFGTLDKLFMVYSKPWWKEEPWTSIIKKGFVRQPLGEAAETASKSTGTDSPDTFVGFTSELPGISINPDGTATSGICRLMLVNLHNLTGFPVLSGFVSCATAVQLEAMTDEEASGIFHRALTKWFGREPPQPEAVHITRWAADEFSKGSYSHMITGLSETRHREVFQEPVVNKEGGVLRFAGEHSSRNHFATVHGALLSGWREADAILSEKGGLS